MAPAITPAVVRQIGSLFDGGSVVGFTDRQLIERFSTRRDPAAEAAFAALVARHGPMVMHVCRRLLRDQHHAEDAFQAVFLVLARKARSIRDPDLLGNWLYGVAMRTARKAKVQIARRRGREEGAAVLRSDSVSGSPIEPMVEAAEDALVIRERAELLLSEIEHLPGPFRRAVVLHYLEGLTLEETAHRLRCPAGTVRSRLARACEKLRRGLTRRGVGLSAAAVTSALASRPASASVASSLCDMTARAAMGFAVGRAVTGAASVVATALAREVLKSMLIHKLKVVGLAVIFAGSVAFGVGYTGLALFRQAARPEPQTPRAGEPVLQPALGRSDQAAANPAPVRMFVTGRVLDQRGQPVPNAVVMVSARSKALGHSPRISRMSAAPIGDARGDASGRFHLDAPRTSSSRHDRFAALAIAPGYGVGWAELDPDADQPTADITLQPEQSIAGRLFDAQGRPAPGVGVSVWTIRPLLSRPALASHVEAVTFPWKNADDLVAWPKPVTTDDEGRFTIRGVARNLRVGLTACHPRFAMQRIEVVTDSPSPSKSITMALEPAKVITGRVTYGDTGKPVPGAVLGVVTRNDAAEVSFLTDFDADAEGRFRINPPSGVGYTITAWPPAGQPYLSKREKFDWAKGAVEHAIDFSLPRGVLVRGTVAEELSGQPVAGATVRFSARAEGQVNALSPSGSTVVETAPDGSFQLGAPPSAGYLSIMGPSDDYVLRTISSRMIDEGRPGGRRYYAHANAFLDLKPDVPDKQVQVRLRRGATVKGRIIGPDGQPVRETWLFSRILTPPTSSVWKIWMGNHHAIARNGYFEVHGLDADAEVAVHFLDPKHKLGATAAFSAQSAMSGPTTVRLEPCGSATGRLVNTDDKPLAARRPRVRVMMFVTPGSVDTIANETAGLVAADASDLIKVDPINYQKPLAPDPEGRFMLPVLIPGATYRLIDYSTARDPTGPLVRKEFTVKPGEAVDLGDIVIEKLWE